MLDQHGPPEALVVVSSVQRRGPSGEECWGAGLRKPGPDCSLWPFSPQAIPA